jgi:hypothetical protein
VESDYLFANFLQLSAFNSTDVAGPNRQVRPDREKLIQLILRIYRWNLRPGIIERIRRMHSNARLPHLCEPACVRSIRLSPQTILGTDASGEHKKERGEPNYATPRRDVHGLTLCIGTT